MRSKKMTPPEWMNDPEAFDTDYEELQALFADLHNDDENIVEGDLCDIVRQHAENEEE
jgi:hypothetical protein